MMETSLEWLAGEAPAIPARALARTAGKLELYGDESIFRQALGELTILGGPETVAPLHRSALLMIKPDGLKAGKGSTILDFVLERGFVPLWWQRQRLAPAAWHALWRYQLTSATLDRLAVNDLVLDGPAMLLLLRGPEQDSLPASVRLSELKGPSDVKRQSPDCLRRYLHQPNRVMSFLHVADEPADLIREVAILTAAKDRAQVWRALIDGASIDVAPIRAAIQAVPKRSIDPAGALARVAKALARASGDPAARAAGLAGVAAMRLGEAIEWRRFAANLDASAARCRRWDLAVLGSHYIIYDRADGVKRIPPGQASLWAD